MAGVDDAACLCVLSSMGPRLFLSLGTKCFEKKGKETKGRSDRGGGAVFWPASSTARKALASVENLGRG